ncbi:MAG: UvrD-helicase domain-containing protein, partial [Ignavibacteria bacterium]
MSKNELKKIKEFREHILSAKISTIHSFCFDLLKEFPVEAGIDPATEIIEDLYKKELIERSIEEILIENINDENVREILRIFGKETTISQLQSLIEKRYFTDQIIQNIYQVDSENVNNFENYFEYINKTAQEYFRHSYLHKLKYARELLPKIKNEITLKKNKDEFIDTISDLEKIFDDFLSELDFKKLVSIFEAVITSLLNQDFNVRKTHFKNADESWAISQFQKIIFEIKSFYKNVIWDKEFEKEKYKLSLTLIDLYKKAKEKFHQFKTLEGVLDFDDLLILTDKLLENNQIRNELKNRFIFILVDEFQDTDVIQFNIIKKISENFESDNNVFVVGDEKQSIYGFRNAQLSVFQNFKSYLRNRQEKNNDASVVTLSTSYRSSPSIAAFVNLIFSNLWAEINSSSQVYNYHQKVEYSPLQIGREEYSDESIVLLVSNEENQSHKVANYILCLIDSKKEIFDRNELKFRKINFGDIALLFRTRAEIKEFENVFIEKNIPFVVSGGRGYYQS